jgi:tetratricopeptide (TPR) repeat protein
VKKTIAILTILITFWIEGSFAQQSDSQLAFQYYRDKQYEKAAPLFDKLYSRTRSRSYFNYYIYCLTNLKEYSLAEKIIKKEIRRNPSNKSFLVELGYLYKQTNKPGKMQEKYQLAIKKLLPVDRDIKDLANAFVSKREYEMALATYEKGRSIRKQNHLYYFEIANIHLYQRNFEKMLEEFMIALSVDPTKLKQVESRLQSALFQDINGDLAPLMKRKLIQRIQSKNSNPVFNELLLWYFIQNKEYSSALRQARALDLRLKENGERLLRLARLAIASKDYENAFTAYQYIIEKGKGSKNYLTGRMGALNVQLLQLEEKKVRTPIEIHQLENQFKEFLQETDFKPSILPAILNLARLEAFHLNHIDESTQLLEKASKMKGLNSRRRSEVKMLRADVALLAGKIWDSILLYAQIEKANKNNPIGFEAKFKKAKVAYYSGDLDWAQTQLDVLKGSTSKLIANDAIALSQLINDNTSLDSTEQAMKQYARADYLHYQRKDTAALATLDSLIRNHPGHSLLDEAYFKKFEIYSFLKEKDKALEALNKIVNDSPYELLADKALFHRALLHEAEKQNQKAMDSYKMILTNYPGSIFVIEARNRYRALRGN